jgi:hypothetical protein
MHILNYTVKFFLPGVERILNTGPAPRNGSVRYTLWSILEERPQHFFDQESLSRDFHRSSELGELLPEKLRVALEI